MEIAQKLIICGASVEATEGRPSCLHLVKNVDAAQALLDAGADVDVVNSSDGNRPIHVVESTEMLDFLIQNGADPNAVDRNGKAPIHLFIDRGWVDGVKALVEDGASLNVRSDGKTLVEYVRSSSKTELVNFFIGKMNTSLLAGRVGALRLAPSSVQRQDASQPEQSGSVLNAEALRRLDPQAGARGHRGSVSSVSSFPRSVRGNRR